MNASPSVDINYYHLQQNDIDEKIIELGIRSVVFQFSVVAVEVYPSPTMDFATVKFTADIFNQATLLDLTGKVLTQRSITATKMSLAVI